MSSAPPKKYHYLVFDGVRSSSGCINKMFKSAHAYVEATLVRPAAATPVSSMELRI